jgi:hypothetical protein
MTIFAFTLIFTHYLHFFQSFLFVAASIGTYWILWLFPFIISSIIHILFSLDLSEFPFVFSYYICNSPPADSFSFMIYQIFLLWPKAKLQYTYVYYSNSLHWIVGFWQNYSFISFSQIFQYSVKIRHLSNVIVEEDSNYSALLLLLCCPARGSRRPISFQKSFFGTPHGLSNLASNRRMAGGLWDIKGNISFLRETCEIKFFCIGIVGEFREIFIPVDSHKISPEFL